MADVVDAAPANAKPPTPPQATVRPRRSTTTFKKYEQLPEQQDTDQARLGVASKTGDAAGARKAFEAGADVNAGLYDKDGLMEPARRAAAEAAAAAAAAAAAGEIAI